MAHSEVISDFEYLRARAFIARTLVKEGRVSPETGLFFAVWPTREMRDQERKVRRTTIASRAYSPRLNV